MTHVCPHCNVAFDTGEAPNVQTFRMAMGSQEILVGDSIQRIIKAHGWYQSAMALTHRSPANIEEERLWFDFFRAGFTEEQLYDVFKYLKSRIKEKRRQEGALTLRNLINPIQFREDLNLQQMDPAKRDLL